MGYTLEDLLLCCETKTYPKAISDKVIIIYVPMCILAWTFRSQKK